MTERPLLSIIIPTKDRSDQLMSTLSCHAWLNEKTDVELVIADNSLHSLDVSEIRKTSGLNVAIKYENQVESLTINENFRRGLYLSSGKFVFFMGDDDFILAESLPAIREIEAMGFDCVFGAPASYYWPSCVFHSSSIYQPNQLLLPKPITEGHAVDVCRAYSKSMRNGFLSQEEMPRAYHGIVRRRIFEEIEELYGASIFEGTPDMAMQVSLALHGTKTFRWPRAICVAGASKGTGGGMTTQKQHFRQFEEVSWLDDDIFKTWPNIIPRYWSEFTIPSATAAYVQAKMGHKQQFGFEAVIAAILVNERSHYRKVIELLGFNVLRFLQSLPLIAFMLVRKTAGRAFRYFKKEKEPIILDGPKELFQVLDEHNI